MSWKRLKSVVRSIQSTVESEPKQLASLRPMVADALEILSGPNSEEAHDELEYLLTKIQEFVIPWRPSKDPSPDFLYIQPGWASGTDDQASEALRILGETPPSAGQSSNGQPSSSIDSEAALTMKVFISHSSADQEVAEALVELLRSALALPAKDIRCTSVDGYRLPAGTDSNEQLRSEVFGCEAFIALLSPASMRSVYVMFELGARWGTKKHLAPIMVCGTEARDLHAPLSGIHSINGTSESEVHQFIDDLARHLQRQSEGASVYGKQLKEFTARSSSKQTA